MTDKTPSGQNYHLHQGAIDLALPGLTKAFDLSANSVIITDTAGIIVYANPHFYEVTGFTQEEVIGHNPRIFKHNDSRIDYAKMWETIKSGNVYKGEFVNRKRTGELFWETGTISPIKDSLGNITYFLAIKEDITLLKKTEAQLQQARNYYFNLLDDFPEMVWKCDQKGNFNFFNKTLVRFAGWKCSPDEYYAAFRNAVLDEDLPGLTTVLNKHLNEATEFRIEFRLRDSTGTYRWLHNHGKPYYDFSGDYNGMVCSCTDIHDRKIAEEKLLKNEMEYRRMFEDSPLGIFQLDRQFLLTKANLSFARFFGFSDSNSAVEALNSTPGKFFPKLSLSKDFYRHILAAKCQSSALEAEFTDNKGYTRHARIFFRKVQNARENKMFLIEGVMEDVTQQKKAEQKLKNSRRKFQSLFENSFNAILILDGLKILEYNKQLLHLLGIKNRVRRPSRIDKLCPLQQYNGELTRDFLTTKIQEVLYGKSQVFSLLMNCQGKQFNAEVSFSRIQVEHQMMIQAIVRDISERVKAEKLIRLAREKAEKARNAQTEFLSMMSHEIRTPLNAVVSLSDLMLHDNPRPDQQQNMHSISISAKHLLGLIDDILDYNKIESGNIQFEQENLNIRQLVDQAFQTVAVKAKEKHLILTSRISDDIPEYIIGDSLRIKQILINLLSNAVKFTERGQITATVRSNMSQSGQGTIMFCIKDTGIGIKQEVQELIFERFSQANLSTSRKYGGSGLGLSICKRLVEMQGGNISVSSLPGAGTEFCFTLPLLIGTKESILRQNVAGQNVTYDLSGLRILMIEDDRMNQFVGKQIIQGKGKASLDIAANGNVALGLLKSRCYDLVITDLLLPDLNGFDLTRLIRANPDGQICHPNLPIVAFTADAFTETRNKAFEAGVNAFITKPVDFLKLLGTISQLAKSSAI